MLINLAVLIFLKEIEHSISDSHGEAEAFVHILCNGAETLRKKSTNYLEINFV